MGGFSSGEVVNVAKNRFRAVGRWESQKCRVEGTEESQD